MSNEHAGDDYLQWSKNAACRDTDPNLFFPIGTRGPAVEQIVNAKKLCRACIAQVACLQYALNNKIDYGIWGGATEDERRRILKSRAKTDSA